MSQNATFQATPINVPTLAEIAQLYKRAVASNDDRLKTLAEQAVQRLAAAEAAGAETATLVHFASAVRT